MATPRLLPTLAKLAAAFVLLALLAEVSVRLVDGHLPPPTAGDTEEVVRKHSRLQQLEADGASPDLVFLGNSTMDAGLDPAVFDEQSAAFDHSYNAALLGTTLDVQGRWIDDFVLPASDPSAVVLGITPLDVLEGTLGETDAAILDESFDAKFDEIDDGPLAAASRTAADASSLVRHRASVRAPATLAVAAYDTIRGEDAPPHPGRPAAFWDTNLRDDGAVLAYREPVLQSPNAVLVADLTTALESPARLDRVDELVARVDGTPAVIVIPPIALGALEPSGVPVDRWEQAAASISERADRLGVPVVDLSAAGYPATSFADPIHLNAEGAAQLSADVAAAVDALCAQGQLERCSAP